MSRPFENQQELDMFCEMLKRNTPEGLIQMLRSEARIAGIMEFNFEMEKAQNAEVRCRLVADEMIQRMKYGARPSDTVITF